MDGIAFLTDRLRLVMDMGVAISEVCSYHRLAACCTPSAFTCCVSQINPYAKAAFAVAKLVFTVRAPTLTGVSNAKDVV